VVAVGEQHTRAAFDGTCGAVHLFGAGTGEHVTHDGTGGQAAADQPRERGIVAAPAADDHGDLASFGRVSCGDPVGVGHFTDQTAVGADEAVQPVAFERLGPAEGAWWAFGRTHAVLPATLSARWSSRARRAASLLSTTTVASSSASGLGGYVGFGRATTVRPAAAAARMPLLESSTPRHSSPLRPRREAASRYTSGLGLPRGTSALDTVAVNSSVSP